MEAAFERLSGRLTTNIRRIRARAGLTQAAVAERVGVSDRYIAALEMARATPNLTLRALAALSRGLGCDPSELLAAAPRPNKRTSGRPRGRPATGERSRRG